MKNVKFKNKQKWFPFLVVLPILIMATTCGPDEEFVFVKNNSNNSILCIPNFSEESLDSIPRDLSAWLDYSLVVEPNNMGAMVLYEKRKNVFKNLSKVSFCFSVRVDVNSSSFLHINLTSLSTLVPCLIYLS